MGRVSAFVLSGALLGGTLLACTSTARISDLYTALDGNGDRKRSSFFTDTKEIHCVVEMGIGRAGVTVNAYVRQVQAYDFVADKFFEVDRGEAEAENSPSAGEGIQKLDVLLKPLAPDGSEADGAPFPPGRFQCEASLDGDLEKTTIFNIDFPDCPDVQIQDGTLCFGFYRNNTQCPRFGRTSSDTAQCVCSITKGWECAK